MTWPAVVAGRLRTPTINQGFSGWIPRHLMYYALLHDADCVTQDQLSKIPVAEHENRRNQPDIDHERTFIEDGQKVRVCAVGVKRIPASVLRWQASLHQWVAEDSSGVLPNPAPISGIVLWMGANGMESDDTVQSIKTILGALHPSYQQYLIINLINRANPDWPPATIARWRIWISECNAALAAAFPGHILNLQEWITSPQFQTTRVRPHATKEEIRLDQKDQLSGIVPRSLRAPENMTHLNAAGYECVGSLVSDWIIRNHWDLR